MSDIFEKCNRYFVKRIFLVEDFDADADLDDIVTPRLGSLSERSGAFGSDTPSSPPSLTTINVTQGSANMYVYKHDGSGKLSLSNLHVLQPHELHEISWRTALVEFKLQHEKLMEPTPTEDELLIRALWRQLFDWIRKVWRTLNRLFRRKQRQANIIDHHHPTVQHLEILAPCWKIVELEKIQKQGKERTGQ